MFLDCLRARLPGATCAASVATAALWPLASATAQTAPVASAASAAPAEMTPAERAKRDGDKVFHWILIHGDKPRKPAATVAPKDDKAPPAVARAKPAARAPSRVDEPVVEASASAPPAAAAPQASLAPDPAPVVSAPEPPPTRAASPSLASAALTAPPVPAAAPVEDDSPETLRPLSQAEPKFPINVVRALRSGQVRVKFTVQPDGSVADPTVIGSSSARLNPSALAAVAQWRFAPVRKAQQGVVELGFKDEQ